jgi:feruloyl-CoA synthase
MIFYAGAALPPDLWQRLEDVSIAATGKRVAMVSAWGSTETAPLATGVHWPIDGAGVIGLPVPGVDIKMVPNAGKMELRVKGPNVTPGYLHRDDLTAEAFDDEGFYCIGDAGRLEDPDDPRRGIVFDGRVVEDFKLTSGTWVHVGGLRVAALAAASPVLQDAVVTGHDRERVGLLAWPSLAGCRAIAGDAGAEMDALIANPDVIARVKAGLAEYNSTHAGSSTRVTRVMLMAEPASVDANEITDKGYINQRAVLERRAGLVERLYAEPPESDVIVIDT